MQLRCTRAVIFPVSCAIKLATLYISNISVWLSVLLENARFQRNSTQKIVEKKTLHTRALDRSLDIIGKWGFEGKRN